MYVFIFTRPDNLDISETGDTVHSGFKDLDMLGDYTIKSLNQIAQSLNHSPGTGIILTQDASSKALTIEVRDYAKLVKTERLEAVGLLNGCRVLDKKDLNVDALLTGNYFSNQCDNSPDKAKKFFIQTLAVTDYIWMKAIDVETQQRHVRLFNTQGWSAWQYENAFIPTKDVKGNIWLEVGE